MTTYSKDQKEALLKRMMPPNPVSVPTLSKETGIPEGTLYTWKSHYQNQGHAVPATDKRPEQWSAQDKLAIVCEARSLKGVELGEYCRKKGLYPEQIKNWEASALKGYQLQDQQDKQQLTQTKADRLKIEQLEAELRRKDAALAETAALLVLSKKAQAIWGKRGIMISPEDRQMAIQLIDEAVSAGARQFKACDILGISSRTLQRWKKRA